MIIFIIYLALVNVIGFTMMGYDKSKAKQGGLRVPEKRLFGFAAAGGALGIWLGSRAFRHKTKHISFSIGLPVMFLLNVLCIYYLSKIIFS
jgi:uncharacterized membrane protein YsdA (DUF1294 family)